MRFTLILLLLTITSLAKGQKIDNSEIRFDGFYKTKAEVDKRDHDTTYDYLRFYPTGKVISVSSDGTPDDLKTWFNLNHDNVSVGDFAITGKKNYFSTTEKHGGVTVIYNGKIKNQNYLVLKTLSLSNGYEDREKYYFVEVPGLN
jgi:hypothetical protein